MYQITNKEEKYLKLLVMNKDAFTTKIVMMKI